MAVVRQRTGRWSPEEVDQLSADHIAAQQRISKLEAQLEMRDQALRNLRERLVQLESIHRDGDDGRQHERQIALWKVEMLERVIEGAGSANTTGGSVQAELDRVLATKTWRYSQRARSMYSRLRSFAPKRT